MGEYRRFEMRRGFIGLLLMCLMLGAGPKAFASDVVTTNESIESESETSIPMIDLVMSTPIDQEDDIKSEEKQLNQEEKKEKASLKILSPEDRFVTTDREVSLSVSAINGDSIDVFVYKMGEDFPRLKAKDIEVKDIGICLHELKFENTGKYSIVVELKSDGEKVAKVETSLSIIDKKEAREYMKKTIEKLDIENVFKQVIETKDEKSDTVEEETLEDELIEDEFIEIEFEKEKNETVKKLDAKGSISINQEPATEEEK